MSANRRLPIGLTIATAISLVILIVLGTWQLQRLAWKTKLLADIAAARTAAPVSVDEILRLRMEGQPIEWRRVALTCTTDDPPPRVGHSPERDEHGLTYSLDGGEIAWRLLSPCRPANHPGMTVVLDRGFAAAQDGVLEPQQIDFVMPVSAVGFVRLPEQPKTSWAPQAPWPSIPGGFHAAKKDGSVLRRLGSGLAPAADFYVAVESEKPQPAGLRPTPTPPDIPNRHLEYALTWYGLAGALLAIYAAMLWRRFKAQ